MYQQVFFVLTCQCNNITTGLVSSDQSLVQITSVTSDQMLPMHSEALVPPNPKELVRASRRPGVRQLCATQGT